MNLKRNDIVVCLSVLAFGAGGQIANADTTVLGEITTSTLTVTGPVAMSSATIDSLSVSTMTAVSSATITALTVGTLTTASVLGKLRQSPVACTSTTPSATTMNTFQTTYLTCSITPVSSSDTILILASANLRIDGAADVFATIARGNKNLLAGNGQTFGRGQTGTTAGANAANFPATLSYLDSPLITGSTTYAIQIRNNNSATTVTWGDASVTQSMVLLDFGP